MEIEESRLKFEFSDENKVVKFDDTKFYRDYFNKLPTSKGVDFIAVGAGRIAFIEVKNCLGDEGNCRWRIYPNNRKRITSHTIVDVNGRDSLDIEVPQKVAMTLAALTGAKTFGENKASVKELEDVIQAISSRKFSSEKNQTYIILFLEGNFGGHTRTKKIFRLVP